MNRLLIMILLVLVVAAVAVVAGTSGELPARVAVHFGANGEANRWWSRSAYEIAMLALVVVLPLLMLALIAWLPRLGACACKLPNRVYWMAPERRQRTLERLDRYASVMGFVLVVFLTAIHLLVVDANGSTRPTLPVAPFVAVMVGFAVATIAWTITMRYGFRRPA